jgi:hypothetical protein
MVLPLPLLVLHLLQHHETVPIARPRANDIVPALRLLQRDKAPALERVQHPAEFGNAADRGPFCQLPEGHGPLPLLKSPPEKVGRLHKGMER